MMFGCRPTIGAAVFASPAKTEKRGNTLLIQTGNGASFIWSHQSARCFDLA
jgi:hypothetical protein